MPAPGRGARSLLALALLGACGGAPDRDAPAQSAILITIDTARADAFGPWGGPPGLTPAVDALAAEGVAYAWARTVAPITLPAHASMLTGLYPPRHTLRDNGRRRLPAAAETLAELARAEGLATGAFVGAVVLEPIFGLDQGFDVYDAPPRTPAIDGAPRGERPGAEVVAAAQRWLETLDRGTPYLLWVHLFDPHYPRVAAERHLERAPRQNPYLAEIVAADEAVGELLAALERRGDLKSALVVLVGDHGESLGQHGEPTHAAFLFDSTVRVPFVVRYPDGWGAGTQSRAIVGVTDVFPTICDALGLEPALAPADLDGESLHRREPPPGRGVYFECYYGWLNYGWAPIAGWADAGGKYLHGTRPELYDPARDPLETVDLARSGAPDLEPYRRALGSVLRPGLEPEGLVAGEELLAELGALGYASTGSAGDELPSPLELVDRPAPHGQAVELGLYLDATVKAEENQNEEAIELLRQVLAGNDEHTAAKVLLAACLHRAGRCEEALPLLSELVRRDSDSASCHLNLARCLVEAGQPELAIEHMTRAVELDPGDTSVLRSLIDVHRQRGEEARAAELEVLLRARTKRE